MPINASPEYYKAEAEYLSAQTVEEKIEKLKTAITLAPKHKSSEHLLAQLKSRLAKLKKEAETQKKKKSGRKGIKKTGHAQIVIIGKENSGKSSLLALLTNAKPKISEIPFTTTEPEIGTLDLDGCKVQMIEIPANADKELLSISAGADLILIIAESIKEVSYWAKMLAEMNIKTRKIIVINKIDILDEEEIKKIENLKNSIKISVKTLQGIEELKKKIFDELNLIRVYTKEPGKKQTQEPVILKKDSTIGDLAEKIRKDFKERLEFARVWGSSAKFQGQKCGKEHKLEDKDVIELHV